MGGKNTFSASFHRPLPLALDCSGTQFYLAEDANDTGSDFYISTIFAARSNRSFVKERGGASADTSHRNRNGSIKFRSDRQNILMSPLPANQPLAVHVWQQLAFHLVRSVLVSRR
jgi:hypothetical protein